MWFLKRIGIILFWFLSTAQVSAEGAWTHIEEIDGHTLGIVRSIAIGPDGSVWFGGKKGLFNFDGDNWNKISSENSSYISMAPDGTVWKSGHGKISKLDGETWTDYTPDIGNMPRSIVPISVAPDGTVWGCAVTQGLYHFDGESWELYTTEDGLYDNYVSFVNVDSDGNVWCRYGDPLFCEKESCIFGGVSRFDGEIWKTYNVNDGLISNNVFSIVSSSNGIVYISYWPENGISRFNGESLETISTEQKGKLAIGSDDVLWCIDHMSLKLWRYELGKWTLHKVISPMYLYSIGVDKNGIVWLGMQEGILRYEPYTTNIENKILNPPMFKIIGNFPNPFNSFTNIQFSLLQKGVADISIYSLTGQMIRKLFSEQLTEGVYSVIWDGKDDNGITVGSGMYISRISMKLSTASCRITVVK